MKPETGQTVVFIGSGNVATHLAMALKNAGMDITTIWSPGKKNRETLAALINSSAPKTLADIDKNADFYIIAVSDDKISEVVQAMPKVSGTVAHTSGITPLKTISERFENSGVFYPLQTFSKARQVSTSDIPFCIEGNNSKSLQSLSMLAQSISRHLFNINTEERMKLHLAAVFVSNFVNHLYLSAEELLQKEGLPFDLLKPLIEEVANKVMNLSPQEAQTGPARRNDLNTIAKHEKMLQNHPGQIELYKLFTKQIINKYHE